jgi:phenylacetate-CoA ligase
MIGQPAYVKLQRSQWFDRTRLERLQSRKLREIVQHAYRGVPYYRRLFDEAGLRPEDIRRPEDLVRVPVSTKADLQRAGIEGLAEGLDSGRNHQERTSGSAGRPFVVHYDRAFVAHRNALFLRALRTVGYRPGMKLLLVTAGARKGRKTWRRWHYAPIDTPAESLLSLYRRLRPQVVYGPVTPMLALARHIRSMAPPLVHAPVAVLTTAETLDRTARGRLTEAFKAPVYEAYGLTEAGIVAWECRERRGLHLAEDSAIVELLPAHEQQLSAEGQTPAGRIVLTNLELKAQPFLRFDTGDLGVLEASGPCSCGRELRRMRRIEGRVVDCVRLPDGRIISPYEFTCALERVAGVMRYQVIQERPAEFTVRVELSDEAPPRERIRTVVARVLGELPGLKITVAAEPRIEATRGRKFRVVESRVDSDRGGGGRIGW